MTEIKSFNTKVVLTNETVESIISTAENLNFDWCSSPVNIYVTKAERSKGMSMNFKPQFEVLIENEDGYFGYHII